MADELNGFSRDIVHLIKTLDPTHAVTSGYSIPRRSATHLKRQPEFDRAGLIGDWIPPLSFARTSLMCTERLILSACISIQGRKIFVSDDRPVTNISLSTMRKLALEACTSHSLLVNLATVAQLLYDFLFA